MESIRAVIVWLFKVTIIVSFPLYHDNSIIADHGKKKRITANLLFPMCNDRIDIFAGAKIRE